MSEFTRKLSDSGWQMVNRKAIDDERLSIKARGVLAWLLTRPNDHKIILGYAMARWKITQPTWRKIRKELEEAGYLKVTKSKKDGRFFWAYELTDAPEK